MKLSSVRFPLLLAVTCVCTACPTTGSGSGAGDSGAETAAIPSGKPARVNGESAGAGGVTEKVESVGGRNAAGGSEGGSDDQREAIDPESVETPDRSFNVDGFLSLSYRGRDRGGQNDEDVYGFLSLDGGDPTVDDLTFHLFARATFDLDGDARRPSVFTSLNDVFGDRFDGKVYEAWVELRRSLVPGSIGIEAIRLGRQNINAGFTYLLDGGRIEFERIEDLGDLRLSVYGGVPEFLYESSRSGDWLVGLDARFKPFETTRVDLRYVHANDRNRRLSSDEQDDYASITIRQEVGDDANVTAEWNTIDARTRDVRLAFAWAFPAIDLRLNVDYRWQDDLTREFTAEYDPYIAILGDSFSFHQVNVQISKLWGEHFGVDGGFNGRILDDDSRNGPFNRDYVRGWLSLSTYDFPAKDVDVSLTGEFWSASKDDAASIGAEIEWRAEDHLEFRLGSYYSLYKYDLFTIDEREDVYTVYVRIEWDLVKSLELDTRYEFETGAEGDFHSVMVQLTWRF